ncbi:hypothetical protein PM076_14250 [Halorubrum ezzemoulense]|uniref:Phosphate ABC transporter permease subunit PstC n=1 Tax=Halorubrum ezzemoulense TaxID=337243 RepID=A0ABT4Z372_HALEZ|nr:hypothetical protein [Halorubrum ezzemoulense]MDB2245953.1 hypothetical protein [Halorubrum ezzemoulense]MDB2252740.1 hypothetical protein [Halorubrum ezzemoulense]MDB2279642.1 hypothetical protein [Halorubrum ezzemoulense]MDB2286127.1 hypothetical protein [Halorubrum ezzemoulense]MDB2289936.1 hypothetical protein [Halorubrum ezzemoulense]
MPDPNSRTDAGPPAGSSPSADSDPDGESGLRDRPALLAATPGTDAVLDQLRTLAILAGLLALLVTLIAVELLVRI